MTLLTKVTALYRTEDDEWHMTDSLFPLWFSTAIEEYTLYRPQTVYAVLETVAEQATYDLPDGIIDLVDVEWYPDDILYADKEPVQTCASSDASAPTVQDHIDHIRTETAKRWSIIDRVAAWYRDGVQVVLLPTPTRDGIGVYIEYTIARTADTIPLRHATAIKDFVVVEALKRRALGHAGKPDMKQGITSWVRRYATPNARRLITLIKADAIARIVEDD